MYRNSNQPREIGRASLVTANPRDWSFEALSLMRHRWPHSFRVRSSRPDLPAVIGGTSATRPEPSKSSTWAKGTAIAGAAVPHSPPRDLPNSI